MVLPKARSTTLRRRPTGICGWQPNSASWALTVCGRLPGSRRWANASRPTWSRDRSRRETAPFGSARRTALRAGRTEILGSIRSSRVSRSRPSSRIMSGRYGPAASGATMANSAKFAMATSTAIRKSMVPGTRSWGCTRTAVGISGWQRFRASGAGERVRGNFIQRPTNRKESADLRTARTAPY
jgi:hypothetical protein